MTRPPRPKYPSDAKDYHEIHRPRPSHADMIRFLFEAADAAIQAVVQSNEFRVVMDSQDVRLEDDEEELNPDMGEVAEDSGDSDQETMFEVGIIHGTSSNAIAADSQLPPGTPAASRVYADASNVVGSRNKSGKRRKPGWISAAVDLWQEQKHRLQDQLLRTGRPLVVYVDCRFDSSRSGYHGTLPVINVEDDKVIEMMTLTRKETGSSWRIESAALELALAQLEDKGLVISEVIYDDCAHELVNITTTIC
ncbi:hypothetical protein R1sor_014018 [Riccia sorocarpa]|uniref:Uncharacterized protein n=1 Tax=Riccia sorocarpa TaxID=122646 RepID=A0ABD3HED5_9MARC